MVRYKKILGVIANYINSIFLLAGCESDQEKELRLKLKLKLEKKHRQKRNAFQALALLYFQKRQFGRIYIHHPQPIFPFLTTHQYLWVTVSIKLVLM